MFDRFDTDTGGFGIPGGWVLLSRYVPISGVRLGSIDFFTGERRKLIFNGSFTALFTTCLKSTGMESNWPSKGMGGIIEMRKNEQ